MQGTFAVSGIETPTTESRASASVGAILVSSYRMTERRFPPPWSIKGLPGGLKVCDANGQSLAYVYSRENPNDAHMAKVLTQDEASPHSEQHRQAANLTWQRRLTAPASAGALFAVIARSILSRRPRTVFNSAP